MPDNHTEDTAEPQGTIADAADYYKRRTARERGNLGEAVAYLRKELDHFETFLDDESTPASIHFDARQVAQAADRVVRLAAQLMRAAQVEQTLEAIRRNPARYAGKGDAS